MKSCHEPVVVRCESGTDPTSFIWRCRLYRIETVEDRWRRAGDWWIDGRGFRRSYFRVTARPVAQPRAKGRILIAELYQQGANWIIDRVYD